ncbi:uncharacterized protein VICG_01525 [Vittaforma corneae ATCC 50505]|uniref:Uncharacterized protein n=1 Tax=Vittaforma corneae (strain ATCC 50505) TaxID=993615 RepID=L2GLN9_VITCO|nr:uncharacterized protein VICG_01525 [Vittaforma corneae ATCC 50505]ELA41420.1 hypothetical protein VICG_01525 [Vittaforma corneae ATCC 50505]
MKCLANQLNKVKNFSEHTSKTKSHDINPSIATEVLNCILKEEDTIENKHILVLNSEAGILHVGLNLCHPVFLTSIVSDTPNENIKQNVTEFNVSCDFIVSNTQVFKKNALDIAVVGPILEKSKCSSLSLIKMATQTAKITYCVFQTEHMKKLVENFPNYTVIGTVNIKMPGSSNYYKQNIGHVEHTIFKLKNNE